LERALDLGNLGPLLLLTSYQTPAALRRVGRERLVTWLRYRNVRGAGPLADAALDAVERQHTALPGEKITATITAGFGASSTPPHWSASSSIRTRGSFTTANARRGRSRSRQCSPSPADASTSSGL
jgi:hypothetical protein